MILKWVQTFRVLVVRRVGQGFHWPHLQGPVWEGAGGVQGAILGRSWKIYSKTMFLGLSQVYY